MKNSTGSLDGLRRFLRSISGKTERVDDRFEEPSVSTTDGKYLGGCLEGPGDLPS